METVKRLFCECCGAPLEDTKSRDRMFCPYCGSRYQLKSNGAIHRSEMMIHYVPGEVTTVCASAHIPDSSLASLPPEVLMGNVKRKLADELTGFVLKNMDIRVRNNQFEADRLVTAYLRIVSPNYRFSEEVNP